MPAPIVADAERTTVLTIAIDYLGNGSAADVADMVLAVASAVHHSVIPDFRITDEFGQRWIFDPTGGPHGGLINLP